MIIRTVLGDIPPSTAGVTYAHEHFIIDSPLVAERWPQISLPSVEEAVAELSLCAVAGVGTVVDTMPLGSGGDPRKLSAVSTATGVHIVAATGMHTLKYYEGLPWVNDPTEALAARFISDIQGTAPRCGIIKLATSGELPTDWEKRLFEAGVEAHQHTGAPIITHCEEGKGGISQIELLTGLGVDTAKLILSHTDKVLDTSYHRDLLATGVNLVYDQALRQVDGPPTTASLISTMWSDGFGDQILLGTDGARRSLWASLGGSPGLAWLAEELPTVLGGHGVGARRVEAMLVVNPARALAFDPV